MIYVTANGACLGYGSPSCSVDEQTRLARELFEIEEASQSAEGDIGRFAVLLNMRSLK